MALVECSECGKEISDKATICPRCGCPVDVFQSEKRFPTYTMLSLGFLVLFLLSMVFSLLGWIGNSIVLMVSFVFSIVALKDREKLMVLSILSLFVSGFIILMILVSIITS